jgi:hypothetical protein
MNYSPKYDKITPGFTQLHKDNITCFIEKNIDIARYRKK